MAVSDLESRFLVLELELELLLLLLVLLLSGDKEEVERRGLGPAWTGDVRPPAGDSAVLDLIESELMVLIFCFLTSSFLRLLMP